MADNFEESLDKISNLNLDDFQKKVDSVRKIDVKAILKKLEDAGRTDNEIYKNLSAVKDIDFNEYQKALDSVKKMGIGLKKDNLIVNKQKNINSSKAIFISYSHEDSKYLKRLNVHLKPLERQGLVELWDDTKIKVGDKWEEEILKALNRSAIAILIISADFLASDFIIENELPPLLEKASSNGTQILPIILKKSRFEREKTLSQFQALNSPNAPILSMTEHEQEVLWDKLAERIEELVAN
ncbi:MAG: toll/interleukin-1 receptor domain-containing protein [Campylobacterota bacterium]